MKSFGAGVAVAARRNGIGLAHLDQPVAVVAVEAFEDRAFVEDHAAEPAQVEVLELLVVGDGTARMRSSHAASTWLTSG
jgi:hypothetical protein